MRILVTGADGQLGKEIQKIYAEEGYIVFPYNKSQLDITNKIEIQKVISKCKPDLIINAAAYTKVDLCESEVEKAYLINAIGPFNLAYEAKLSSCKFIHISTDYVFAGDKTVPYVENDKTSPKTVYGKSKSVGEELVIAINGESIIIRTSWLYGHFGDNFVKTIAKLSNEFEEIKVVNDQIGSPTYTKDLAIAMKELMNKPPGIYHVSNQGSCSWYELACEVIRILNKKTMIIPVSTKEYGLATPRPTYSVLSNQKMTNLQISQRTWKEALGEFIRKEYFLK